MDDKLFFNIWTCACKSNNKDEFLRIWLHPKHFKGIKLDQYYVVTTIYDASKLTMHEILDRIGEKKSVISHKYCIPIRTVEDWYYGKSKPPDYIRLLFIRDYKLVNFRHKVRPKKVVTEKYVDDKLEELLRRSEETRKMLEEWGK